MRSSSLCSLTVVMGIAVLVSSTSAQTITGNMYPGGQPLSPYLNLLRFGSLPAVNYYNLVQPQLQFQSAISGLQQNQSGLEEAVTTGTGGASGPVTTGHPAMFANYSHYFGGLSTIGGTGGGGFGGTGGGGFGGFGGVGAGGALGVGGVGGMGAGGMGGSMPSIGGMGGMGMPSMGGMGMPR